ncbi:MAG: hypothetical protein COA58_14010 [Bacteroidetes bacterium]|nr:MAG: hypothetical protein COA58_14010 [Bacteroidota bacterium]
MTFKNVLPNYVLLSIIVFTTMSIKAQPSLNPKIGPNTLPADNDEICSYEIPSNPDMTFDSYSYFVGDTIPEFTLYDIEGDSLNIATLLSKGKPVLMVALNYTCPYVRNKVSTFNDIIDNYSDDVTIIGVYQLEAHPADDYSPNSGRYGNVSMNENSGIIVNQHKTYLDRKKAAQDFINATGIKIPVYLDGPCNEWWSNFGPGPSTGYIIKPNGSVFAKHGWFDKYANGHEIYCDIESLYGRDCDGTNPTGQFAMKLTTNDTMYGPLGSTIDVEADLINNSGEDVLIEIERNQNDISIGWESAMCMDVCLTPTIDEYSFLLKDGETQHFWMHFYSSLESESTGHTKVIFRNANDFSNQYVQNFYATSSEKLSSIDNLDIHSFSIKPNPMTKYATLTVPSNQKISQVRVYSYSGELVLHEFVDVPKQDFHLDCTNIKSGMYIIEISAKNGPLMRQRILKQ